MKKAANGRCAGPALAKRIEQHRGQLEAYEGLCEDLGEAPADVALAWLLQNPIVTAPLIGPRTVEQLKDALRATSVSLSDDTVRCLEEIWPGPGGEAPQAYAW
nr:aldo/keto reductase [Pseudomonas orientalis]